MYFEYTIDPEEIEGMIDDLEDKYWLFRVAIEETMAIELHFYTAPERFNRLLALRDVCWSDYKAVSEGGMYNLVYDEKMRRAFTDSLKTGKTIKLPIPKVLEADYDSDFPTNSYEFLYNILDNTYNAWIAIEVVYDLLEQIDDVVFEDWLSENPISEINDLATKRAKKLDWLGDQKELTDLFVTLKQKGWIREVESKTIKSAFTKTDTIHQVLKPNQSKETKFEPVYPQIYSAKYSSPFSKIQDKT